MSTGERDGITLPDTGAVSRYDVVLAVILLSFLGSVLLRELLSVDGEVALAAASVLGLFALIDAVVLNPPGPGSGSGEGVA